MNANLILITQARIAVPSVISPVDLNELAKLVLRLNKGMISHRN